MSSPTSDKMFLTEWFFYYYTFVIIMFEFLAGNLISWLLFKEVDIVLSDLWTTHTALNKYSCSLKIFKMKKQSEQWVSRLFPSNFQFSVLYVCFSDLCNDKVLTSSFQHWKPWRCHKKVWQPQLCVLSSKYKPLYLLSLSAFNLLGLY